MNQIRELLVFKDYFYAFFNEQPPYVKEKIDYVLFLITHVEKIPTKFLKHIEGTQGLYEIRIGIRNNIFRIFCCFDKGKIVVLLNGYQKKEQKTNRKQIEMAIKIMKLYFQSTT